MPTPEQLQLALQRAQAAGDTAAVQDLQGRLNAAAATAPQGQGQKPFVRAGEGSVGHRLFGNGAFASGIGDSAIRSYLGLKQFFGGLSDDEKAVLAQMEKEQSEDPDKWTRIGGNVAGSVAQMANPLGAAAGRAGGALMGARMARATAANPALAAALAGGAQGFVLNPGEGDGFADQMLGKVEEAGKSAVLGGALSKVTRAIASPLTGMFKATPEAEALFRQGVNPTLQQGAAGSMGKFIGGLTSGALDVKGRQRDEIGNAMLRKITKGQQELPGGTGREFFEAGQDAMDRGYSSLWGGKKVNLSPSAVQKVLDEVGKVPKSGRGSREADLARALMVNRLGPNPMPNQRLNYDTFASEIRNKITRDAFTEAGDVRDRMLAGREVLDNLVTLKNLSPDETATLQNLNLRNFDLKRLEEAVRGAASGQEGVSVRSLAAAYGNRANEARSMGNTTAEELINPAARVMGNTPNQDMARTAWQAVKKMGVPAVGAGLAGGAGAGAAVAAAPIGISLLGQTGPGAKALLGQYGKQKVLADILRKLEPAYGPAGAADWSMGD